MFFFFISVFTISQSANTVCYYTTLKQERVFEVSQERFSTLWNYTTLKPKKQGEVYKRVSVPYEITLLSN